MQLDADEDGEPFFKPQPPLSAPIPSGQPKRAEGPGGGEQPQQRQSGADEGREEGETAQAAAATLTAEQEE